MTYNFRAKDYTFWLVGLLVLLGAMFLKPTVALIVVSALAAIYAWLRPKEALLLMVLYVPIRPFLVEMNTGLKLAGDIVTFVVLLKVLWDTRSDWKSWFRFHLFEWAFFVFLVLGAVVGYMTGSSLGAVIFQVRTFLIMYILYYVVSRLGIKQEDYVRFAWVTILTSVVISFHGLVEKLSLRLWLMPDTWSEMTLSATNIIRIYGLTGNPNSLAIYLSFTLVMTLYLLKRVSDTQRKALYALLVLFMGVFILTYSRGTFIGLVVGFIFYLLFTRNWKVVKPIIVTGLISILLVYFPVNYGVDLVKSWGVENAGGGDGEGKGLGKRLEDTLDPETLRLMTESGRFFYLKVGYAIYKDNPIVGSGFATFGDSATLSYGSPLYDELGIDSDIYGGRYPYSDNQYIQVIAETGTIGVILFAVFLIGMLSIYWKRRKQDDGFAYILIAIWFATGAMGLIYNIWELKLFTFYYFLLFGAFASVHNIYNLKKKSEL